MRTGVLDIGTNTILLLVADIADDGSIVTVRNEQTIVRLGEGVDRTRNLDAKAMERALSAIDTYLEICRNVKVDHVIAGATSAVRDAGNREEFLDQARQRCGLDIKVLSGAEEAELTYRGAVSSFLEGNVGQSRFAVLDIGGGSTEIISGTGSTPDNIRTFDTGCVRLTERYLHHAPPSREDRKRAREDIRRHLENLPQAAAHGTLIGVAGTLTTLAALDLQADRYDPDLVTGHRLTKARIDELCEWLAGMTIEEIRSQPQILPGRADILLAGVMILKEVMEQTGYAEIVASDRGLRYGLALSV